MCGIFGIVLNKTENVNIYNLVIDGLLQLQNRGYDSAGICLIKNDQFEVNKYASTNKINALDKLVSLNLNSINTGCGIAIGHNRWATHGIKNDTNAHPHLSNDNKFVIVHNGIIENYNELKQMLRENDFS
jgi:glucosamine--fructose-6-phosphate aminotransferase (isomerizing)